jgi:hypothetical protein
VVSPEATIVAAVGIAAEVNDVSDREGRHLSPEHAPTFSGPSEPEVPEPEVPEPGPLASRTRDPTSSTTTDDGANHTRAQPRLPPSYATDPQARARARLCRRDWAEAAPCHGSPQQTYAGPSGDFPLPT